MNDQKTLQKNRFVSSILLFLLILGPLLIIWGIVRLLSEKPEFSFSGTSFTIKNGLADLIFGVIALVIWGFAKWMMRKPKASL